MIDNAPLGSDYENAPWNRPDEPIEYCGQCDGKGYNYTREDEYDMNCVVEKWDCEFCNGTGKR